MDNHSAKILHYTIEGSGPSLVLIHGFLESNSMWEPLLLEKDFTCIKIEIPGHGKSDIELFEESISFMARCVELTIQQIGLDTFDMIGHSLGGYIVLEYAKLFGLNGKIILLHSNFWEDDTQKKKDRQRVANIVLKNKNLFLQEALPGLFLEPKKHFTLINNLLSEAKTMKAQDIAHCAIAMKNRSDHKSTMFKFSSEIYLIQGEKDKLIPLAMMEKQLSNLTNKMVVIPGVGHMGHQESPALVRKEILYLLK